MFVLDDEYSEGSASDEAFVTKECKTGIPGPPGPAGREVERAMLPP